MRNRASAVYGKPTRRSGEYRARAANDQPRRIKEYRSGRGNGWDIGKDLDRAVLQVLRSSASHVHDNQRGWEISLSIRARDEDKSVLRSEGWNYCQLCITNGSPSRIAPCVSRWAFANAGSSPSTSRTSRKRTVRPRARASVSSSLVILGTQGLVGFPIMKLDAIQARTMSWATAMVMASPGA